MGRRHASPGQGLPEHRRLGHRVSCQLPTPDCLTQNTSPSGVWCPPCKGQEMLNFRDTALTPQPAPPAVVDPTYTFYCWAPSP